MPKPCDKKDKNIEIYACLRKMETDGHHCVQDCQVNKSLVFTIIQTCLGHTRMKIQHIICQATKKNSSFEKLESSVSDLHGRKPFILRRRRMVSPINT